MRMQRDWDDRSVRDRSHSRSFSIFAVSLTPLSAVACRPAFITAVRLTTEERRQYAVRPCTLRCSKHLAPAGTGHCAL